MEACPGFFPEHVPVGADRIVGRGLSCRHLTSQPSPGRPGAYVSACTHPVLGDAGGYPGATVQLRATAYSIRGALRSVLET